MSVAELAELLREDAGQLKTSLEVYIEPVKWRYKDMVAAIIDGDKILSDFLSLCASSSAKTLNDLYRDVLECATQTVATVDKELRRVAKRIKELASARGLKLYKSMRHGAGIVLLFTA